MSPQRCKNNGSAVSTVHKLTIVNEIQDDNIGTQKLVRGAGQVFIFTPDAML